MTETTTAPDETQVAKLDDQSTDLVIQARECIVKNDGGLAVASTLLGGIKALLAESASVFDEPQAAAHAAHKAIIAARKKVDDPLKRAEKSVKIAVSNYHAEIYRRQEKARLAAEAEARRLEEARIKAEADAAQAEIDRQKIEDERIKAAIEAEESGDYAKTEELLESIPEPVPVSEPAERPMFISLPVPPPAKVEGMSTSKRYSAKVADFRFLVQFCAAHPAWLHLLKADTSEINRLARADRGAFNIPGCELVVDIGVSSRKT
jgi:hypothetical protein